MQIEKLRPDEVKRSNIARPFIRFEPGDPSGKNVVTLKDISNGYEETLLGDMRRLMW